MQTNRRSGQAVILIAFSLFFLFAVMGLAVDPGLSHNKRRRMQSAAGAAAMGVLTGGTGTPTGASGLTTSTCRVKATIPGTAPGLFFFARPNQTTRVASNATDAIAAGGG